ncbi:MAG: hypothetical protein JEZ00_14760 [Anaerolineaceae bacterium]|nr:hypothetical protein [Anaerolineaceae bacterium]
MTQYKIFLRGHLDTRWEKIFPGFSFDHSMSPEDQPITVMTGQVIDQSAMYGTINRLQNLGIELISFQPQKSDES